MVQTPPMQATGSDGEKGVAPLAWMVNVRANPARDLQRLLFPARPVRRSPRAASSTLLAAAGGQKTSYRTRSRSLNFLPASMAPHFTNCPLFSLFFAGRVPMTSTNLHPGCCARLSGSPADPSARERSAGSSDHRFTISRIPAASARRPLTVRSRTAGARARAGRGGRPQAVADAPRSGASRVRFRRAD